MAEFLIKHDIVWGQLAFKLKMYALFLGDLINEAYFRSIMETSTNPYSVRALGPYRPV